MSVIDLNIVEDHERFRAELASIQPDGRRKWIYARKPSGRFFRYRTILSWFLLAFLFLAPWVKVGGKQFLLLNIIDREFVFFGVPFWPNDFYLVALMFLTTVVTIVVFTATFGRFFCGWICPQTIFMEMVFRKIEWWIEGGPAEQAKRRAGPWTGDRLWRAALKVSIFFTISFAIANTFLAYVVSCDVLVRYVVDGPMAHLELFVGLVTFTIVFFMVFYRFREQVCLVACPYGRYMSALVDENTIAVTYDFYRGESRAKWTREDTAAKKEAKQEAKNEAKSTVSAFARPAGHGDCVDCYQCVTVCPTGIDIRNGIQLECVNCTACIDACDEVMTKVGLPEGLIRYTSQSAVEHGASSWLTTRIKAYLAIWVVLMGVVGTLVAMRGDVDVVILRQEGTTWAQTTDGITNFYRLQLINKTSQPLSYGIRITQPANAQLELLAMPEVVGSQDIAKGRFMVTIPSPSISSKEMKITVELVSEGKVINSTTTSFLSP
jgi:cytochrome c oxidase accessory protein FixG